MASTSEKPKKGILKHSGSVDHSKKEIEWDEMNILATYHPADKDYGFMKVDEPPTPYNKAGVSDNEEETPQDLVRKGSVSSVPDLDPNALAEKLEEREQGPSGKSFDDDGSEESEENENETEEERQKRKAFILKRKMHYNEFQAVQLAKKLMAEEDDDDDDDKATGSSSAGGASAPAQPSNPTSASAEQGSDSSKRKPGATSTSSAS